jgi:hypothetical protein
MQDATDDDAALVILDSITKLTPAQAGRVAVTGSHGGLYSAFLAARCGLRGVIFSDAGIGRDGAGIGGLPLLADAGMPAATVDYRSGRIGDGVDIFGRGVISHVNAPAAAIGCRPGQPTQLCAGRMLCAAPAVRAVAMPSEGRCQLRAGPPRILGLDSISLLTPDDADAIVVSGSHGGLLGGRPDSAVSQPVLAAAFNDAGIGIDRAGLSRLPALDKRGIPAVTVSAASARIGDARSAWETGIISAVNAAALREGAREGLPLAVFLTELAARLPGEAMRAATLGEAAG